MQPAFVLGFDRECPNRLASFEARLRTSPSTRFSSFGSFYALSATGESVLDSCVVITVAAVEAFKFMVNIFNGSEEKLYELGINEYLNIAWDQPTATAMWNYFDAAGNFYAYKLYFPDPQTALTFNYVTSVCIMEHKNQTKLDDYIKKSENEWNQYYLPKIEIPEAEAKEWAKFDAPDLAPMEEEEPAMNRDEGELTFEDSVFAQARILNRTFITHNKDVISVFQVDTDDNDRLKQIVSLPAIETLDKGILKAGSLFFQDSDTKMILTNKDNNKKAYLCDLDKVKVISEFTHDEVAAHSLDVVCPYEKHSDLSTNPTFYSINKKDISLYDPRSKTIAVSRYGPNKYPIFRQRNECLLVDLICCLVVCLKNPK